MTRLDEVRELDPGRSATAVRHVPNTLEVFATHFPRLPVLPGVLILDDLVQVARLALVGVGTTTGAEVGTSWQLAAARRVRYRHFVQPGDSMEINVVVTSVSGDTASCRAVVRVDGKPVTVATELILRSSSEESAT